MHYVCYNSIKLLFYNPFINGIYCLWMLNGLKCSWFGRNDWKNCFAVFWFSTFISKQEGKWEQGSLAALSPQKRSSWARRSSCSPAPRTGTRACTCSSDQLCWPQPSTLPPPTRNVRWPLQFKWAPLSQLKHWYMWFSITIQWRTNFV